MSTDVQEHVNEMMDKAVCAAAVFSQVDQETTNSITRAVFQAGFNKRLELAKMAQEETGIIEIAQPTRHKI
jgi:hypothetical protein